VGNISRPSHLPKFFCSDFVRGDLVPHMDISVYSGVADPDLNLDSSDPYVFGSPGSGSGPISQRYGSGSESYYHQAKIVRKTLIPTVL
jgi:hypothetical protein